MSTENVKIVINEKDTTSPLLFQPSTSDIAFVPGTTGTVTTPQLFTSAKIFANDVMNNSFSITDTGCIMAYELLTRGMPVLYCKVGTSISDVTVAPVLEQLLDKNTYSVKYLTSGGVASLTDNDQNLAAHLIKCAAMRGDCVALVDYSTNSSDVMYAVDTHFGTTKATSSVYSKIDTAVGAMITAKTVEGKSVPPVITAEELSYGTIMYPWATYTTAFGAATSLPGSFAYLMCVATAIKSSPNWLAMAGVARGQVPNINALTIKGTLTNEMAEECQPSKGATNHQYSVNCITDIRPYGNTIWGNRTLKAVSSGGTVALNFLNVRNMISDIKKVLYTTAKIVMFEQNTDSLWLRFKSGVSPLLNQLKSGNGISDFKIIQNKTKYDGTSLRRGEISATVRVYPIYPVEYFELTVEISDQDVTIS